MLFRSIASPAEVSGKTPGTDLREGILTLPMLLVQAQSRSEDAELLGLLGRELPDDAEHARALELMRAHPAMAQAEAEAQKFAERAIDQLSAIRALADVAPMHFATADRVASVLEALEGVCLSTISREV